MYYKYGLHRKCYQNIFYHPQTFAIMFLNSIVLEVYRCVGWIQSDLTTSAMLALSSASPFLASWDSKVSVGYTPLILDGSRMSSRFFSTYCFHVYCVFMNTVTFSILYRREVWTMQKLCCITKNNLWLHLFKFLLWFTVTEPRCRQQLSS